MRELSIRLVLTWLACLLLTGLFALVAVSIHSHTITGFDQAVIGAVQGTERPWLTTVMKAFTTIGSTLAVGLITISVLAVLLFRKHRAQALLLIAAIGGTGVLNQLLKVLFRRARPEFHRLIDIGGYSFPSGHTMMAFSLYTVLAYIIWRNLRTAWSRTLTVLAAAFMIVMIAVSRIYLGVHYPSDIAGGVYASAVWMIASISMYQRFQRKKRQAYS